MIPTLRRLRNDGEGNGDAGQSAGELMRPTQSAGELMRPTQSAGDARSVTAMWSATRWTRRLSSLWRIT